MGSICIIPARIGSKRIPEKNIIDFEGKPIISYSIKTALDSELFSKVIVSTDSQKVVEIALENGAVPFISELHTDYSTMNEICKEAAEGIPIDNICCVYACAPLLQKDDLIKSYEIFNKNNNDMLISIVKVMPFTQLLMIQSGNIHPFNYEYHKRSQDSDICYRETGSFYWIKKEGLYEKTERELKGIWRNCGYYEMPEIRCQELDDIEDLELLKMKYRYLMK